MDYVGQTVTNSHLRPCWAFKKEKCCQLTSTAVPKQGYYHEFDADIVTLVVRRLPEGQLMTVQEISSELADIERTGLRNPDLDKSVRSGSTIQESHRIFRQLFSVQR